MKELQDPMGEELIAARQGTFGLLWPHEGKKGWKCKVGRMVEAGWCFDPAPVDAGVGEEELDGVTCFYCNCSLDGWEPKDDPLKEHTRRSPECAFFKLVRLFGAGAKGAAKGKGKNGVGRASKGSRISAMSAVSQFSEAPSLADLGSFPVDDAEMETAGVDDSIVTTASQATTTGTGKGKKGKAGRAKAPAKGAKGRKRAGSVDSQVDVPLYPDLSSQAQSQPAEEEYIKTAEPLVIEEAAPAKKTRKAPTRGSKAPQIDSSVIEVSSFDLAPQPATKAKRGRKAKAKAEPEPEQEAAGLEDSEVSLQLQEELERSLSIDMDARFEIEEQLASQPEKPKRGVKRTSDGMKKKQQPQEESDVSATVLEFPPPPKPAVKAKKGRKPSKQIEPEQEPQPPAASQADVSISDVEATKPAKAKKAPATKTKGKSKKASSARSSKATTTEPSQPQNEEEEDLERDEREIEAELARIAAEQAQIQREQEKAAEFEASPSASKPPRKVSKQSEPKIVEAVAGSPPAQSPVLHREANPTPSPAGSDKENDPGFTKPSAQPILSLTKLTRIPLAPGTPNRLLSPGKHPLHSPSKHLSHLVSTTPWSPIDLDGALLASPQATPGTLAQRLAGAASGPGVLGSVEKGLSVEEWVRLQAAKAEEELRRRCEETVGAFEREGVRGLGCLQGLGVGVA